KAIGMTAVLEGVETKEQLDHLRAIGATMVQGFYFAKPMPPEALTEMLSVSMRLHGGSAPVAPEKTRRLRRRVA
ncbi:MAG TPA: EAL domain-containing protein, partial [Acidimicrobiales bacterium]|nr:EAL domain-containing protein [Acidimicrobiales bacterium]